MGERRKYKKVKIKRSTFKNELRYLVIITFICLILAFGLAFITMKLTAFSLQPKQPDQKLTAFSIQP